MAQNVLEKDFCPYIFQQLLAIGQYEYFSHTIWYIPIIFYSIKCRMYCYRMIKYKPNKLKDHVQTIYSKIRS